MIESQLNQIENEVKSFHSDLLTKLNNPSVNLNLGHLHTRQLIFNFTLSNPKPAFKQKAKINWFIRRNIQNFIQSYFAGKIIQCLQSSDDYKYVTIFSQAWANFQRYVFAHKFICQKLNQFFQAFYKLQNSRQHQYNDSQVCGIPVIAVNQLQKTFIQLNLYDKFPYIFAKFYSDEIEGKNTPRNFIQKSINCFESSYFDMQAVCIMNKQGKPIITKTTNRLDDISYHRRSKDEIFFKQKLFPRIKQICTNYYKDFITKNYNILTSSEQINKILTLMNLQNERANFYIHNKQNLTQYLQIINEILVCLNINQRINKVDGLKKYLGSYDVNTGDYEEQLKNFWKIYSLKLKQSLPFIREIYSKYLYDQAKIVAGKVDKPRQCIEELIRINVKNIKIASIFQDNFDISNQRNTKIRGMFSNKIISGTKFSDKYNLGAENLAFYINIKFKQVYSLGQQSNNEYFQRIVELFKILRQKDHFIRQYQKHLGNRLCQDVDFSKDIQCNIIISLERNFINEIQKQCGAKDIEILQQNVKDVQAGMKQTKLIIDKLKDKLIKFGQLIVKDPLFWAQKPTYIVETPPTDLLKNTQIIKQYYIKTVKKTIEIQFNQGISTIQGQFNSKIQNFELKNLYILILLILDESPDKTLQYGVLLNNKIKPYGSKKDHNTFELNKHIIELIYSGILISNKQIKQNDNTSSKLSYDDKFTINKNFCFEDELKKQKKPQKIIKGLKVLKRIKTQNLIILPGWLKKMFNAESRQQELKEIQVQKLKTEIIRAAVVRVLKHLNTNCSFQQINKFIHSKELSQYQTTERQLKIIIEKLIQEEYCIRDAQNKNMFRYKRQQ